MSLPRCLRHPCSWLGEVVEAAEDGVVAVEVPADQAAKRKRRRNERAPVLVESIARRPSVMGCPRSALRRHLRRRHHRHRLPHLEQHQLTAVWPFLAPIHEVDRHGRSCRPRTRRSMCSPNWNGENGSRWDWKVQHIARLTRPVELMCRGPMRCYPNRIGPFSLGGDSTRIRRVG